MQIERIVPWGEWVTIIKPCYYEGERGNKPYDIELMLRLHLLQNLYDLADEATAAEVMESRAFSEFCGVDSSNQVRDGDTNPLDTERIYDFCTKLKMELEK